MSFDRTFLALAFVSFLVFTALWGREGLTIDPNGKPAAATAPTHGGAGPLADSGLMIDPNGAK